MMNSYIEEMERISVKAGEFAKEKFLAGITGVSLKARNDYVTDTDRMVEKFIKEELRRSFPEIPLLTEEGSSSAKGDENLFFCLDPLDGTNNYVHSLPIFCVSLALLEGMKPGIGVVYDPMHNELFKAEKGKGAFLNGRKIKTSGKKEIDEAFVATGFPFRERGRVAEYLRGFEKVLNSTGGIRRCGAAALDLCWTAVGRFDAFWEFGLKPWDISAGIVIVQEAKGYISDIYGQEIDIFKGDILASATEELKKSMVSLLK